MIIRITFKFLCHHKKPLLYCAIEKGNFEIVKLLVNNDKLNINDKYIFKKTKFIKFEIYISITFEINSF